MEDRQRIVRGVFPRGWPDGPSELRAECLIEGGSPHVEVSVRLLQIVERQVLDAKGEPVQGLTVAGGRYDQREETAEHVVRLPSLPDRTAEIESAGSKRAELRENGAAAGALVWRSEPLHATIEAWSDEIAPGLRRVSVKVANRLEWDGGTRAQAFLRAFYSTRVIMHSADGAFASLANPPPHLRETSATCDNQGLWPVPVGEAGDRRTILASSVPLEDYPHVGQDGSGHLALR